MRTVTFPQANLETTALAFGCASLMRLTSARERDALLGAAFEQGIRHFDVARLYGLGAAEGEVGRFAKQRRDQVVIATKFGIDPAPGAGRLARFQAPARGLMNRYPALRAAVKRRSSSFTAPSRRYDADIAARSLETSLRELGTDYVDILFLHGPGAGDDIDFDGLNTFFERVIREGKVRAVGISHEAQPGEDMVSRFGSHALLQVRSDILARERRDEPHLTFGVFGAAYERLTAALGASPALAQGWSSRLGVDPLAKGQLSRLLLAEALDANRSGTVLYSTVSTARLVAAAEAENQPPPAEQLDAFRALVTEFAR